MNNSGRSLPIATAVVAAACCLVGAEPVQARGQGAACSAPSLAKAPTKRGVYYHSGKWQPMQAPERWAPFRFPLIASTAAGSEPGLLADFNGKNARTRIGEFQPVFAVRTMEPATEWRFAKLSVVEKHRHFEVKDDDVIAGQYQPVDVANGCVTPSAGLAAGEYLLVAIRDRKGLIGPKSELWEFGIDQPKPTK